SGFQNFRTSELQNFRTSELQNIQNFRTSELQNSAQRASISWVMQKTRF
ncbi:hypothetical protein A2U01_0104907, partial [Trifolium medium]|nr:hypothetical protein [Trifolium medium]